MSDVRLVAVEHGDGGYLVGPSMTPLFRRDVIPHLTAQSVIVAEGGKGRGRLLPADPAYRIIYEQLGPIAFSGIRPLLHSDDAWHTLRTREEVLASIEKLEGYPEVVESFLSLGCIPLTWDEMIDRVRNDDHDAVIVGSMSREWEKFAREEEELSAARDAAFAEQIQHYAREGASVWFVGGALHCITLAAQYGWPVVRYDCPPETIRHLYLNWYYTNRITRHI